MEPTPSNTEPVTPPALAAWRRAWNRTIGLATLFLILVLLEVSDGSPWGSAVWSTLLFAVAVALGMTLFFLGGRLLRWIFHHFPDTPPVD